MYLNNMYTKRNKFEKTCTKYNHILESLIQINTFTTCRWKINYISVYTSTEKLQLTITASNTSYTIIEWVKFRNLLFKKKTNHSTTMII